MKRITGVSTRVLECAKEEFLEKGFQNASIREIAKKAETSPRAIYTRFPNKEGLFDAIVEPAANGLVQLYQDFGDTFWGKYKDLTTIPEFTSDPTLIYPDMIDYIYSHKDEFTLILNSIDGTRYTALIERLTKINFYHLEEYEYLKNSDVPNAKIMMNVLHMLTHSFYAALFEPLRHNMEQKDAHFYVRKLCDFFVAGIANIT